MDSYFDSLLQTSRNKMKLLFSWNHWWESCEIELSFFVYSSSCPLYGMKSHVKQFMGECFRHSDHFSLEWLPRNQTRKRMKKIKPKWYQIRQFDVLTLADLFLLISRTLICVWKTISRKTVESQNVCNRMIYQIRSTQTEYCNRSKNSFLWTFNTSSKPLNCWERA